MVISFVEVLKVNDGVIQHEVQEIRSCAEAL